MRDLDSKNGTWVDGVSVGSARCVTARWLRCGRVALRVLLGDRAVHRPRSERTSFGGLRGRADDARGVRAARARGGQRRHRVARGRTGTGKDGAARALHAEGPRRTGPFVVVDCGAISADVDPRASCSATSAARSPAPSTVAAACFEAARGGTVFLDEIGELPPRAATEAVQALKAREGAASGVRRPCRSRRP
ncbi:MAG: sigma 54-interacting transcriptional regulator [Myxococcales bacterium]|nr:sigma 54-interacting transcriptional regulator [Myxococcales bacterium]